MSWIVVGVTVVSTAASIYGQQQQAKAQTKAAQYNNALAHQEARNVEIQNVENLKRERIRQRKQLAEIRAQLAQSGTLTTEGTPLAILGESSANLNLGIQDAARAANMQAASLRAQGQMGLWEADQGQQAANINSVAAGLSAATSTYTGYVRTKRS